MDEVEKLANKLSEIALGAQLGERRGTQENPFRKMARFLLSDEGREYFYVVAARKLKAGHK